MQPPAERVRNIIAILSKRYPTRTALRFETPFQLLVATILSAQCTDEQVNRVTPELFARYPTPEALAAARQEDVEAIIRPTGFYRQKARSIIEAAKGIVTLYGGEVPRTIEELTKLRGVARKTANVVLYSAYGIQEGIAVDTHVKRVAHRLGLTTHTDPNKIERDLLQITPPDKRGALTLLLIWHGRRVCKARKPRCDQCELLSLCPYGQERMRGGEGTT